MAATSTRRLPVHGVRDRGVRRILRGLVGDAGAAHAVDERDECDFVGDRGRGVAGGWSLAIASAGSYIAKIFGVLALAMASVNIFGGFLVTSRMLAMYKKKEKNG